MVNAIECVLITQDNRVPESPRHHSQRNCGGGLKVVSLSQEVYFCPLSAQETRLSAWLCDVAPYDKGPQQHNGIKNNPIPQSLAYLLLLPFLVKYSEVFHV